jgi:hypothetical protein
VLTPGVAGADPAGPTDARSRVVDVRPPADGARIEVVGGDAFLQLTLDRGHTAVVPGYGGEPYLRFGPDGVVEVNRRSPATYVNGDRQGGAAVPPDADRDAPPQWDRVASGGTYAWHDHRIHWMGDDHPARSTWALSLQVDGRRVVVEGELTALPRPVPVPAAVLGLGALAAVLVVDRRRHPAPLGALTALGAAVVAAVLGWGSWSAQPVGVDPSPLVVAVPVVASVVAGLALVPRWRSRRQVLVLASVALVGGWAVLQLPALWHAIVPSEIATPAVRAGLALVAGLVAAAALLGVRPSPTR